MAKLSRAMWLNLVSFSAVVLTACGGGGGGASLTDNLFGNGTTSTTVSASTSSTATTSTVPTTITTTGPTTTTTLPVGAVTVLDVDSLSNAQQTSLPVTFGHVFAQGDIPSGDTVRATMDGMPLTLQVDAKARHGDGSLRHAVLSAVLPQIGPGQSKGLVLYRTSTASGTAPANALTQLLSGGFTANVSINVGGTAYSASADALLNSGTGSNWLEGPTVNEWLIPAPLKTAGGIEHPHLKAYFAVRSYYGLNKAKVDVIIENGWAYEPNPQGFTYNVQVLVGGQTVYSQNALTHYHHARWRKSFWWGGAPQAHLRHSTAYLIASRAVPNYDQTVRVSETALGYLKTVFDAAPTGPMGNGIATADMRTTGGRPDIGLIPGWGAMTVLSMDKRAKDVTLGMGDLSGSWPTHYRDKITGRPISLADYPYMTLYPPMADSYNPGAGRQEALPECTQACANPNVPDTAHEPAFSYLPYLLTGDHYYLEEMQFYVMWGVGGGVPQYREYGKGLVYSNQIRGQAWILRNLYDAAYILPDSDVMKAQINTILAHNLAWFNTNYTNNVNANVFGALIHSYAFSYQNPYTNQIETGIAPWQDDFFTSVIGHAAERNFAGTSALLAWKAKFSVGRMTSPGYCWVMGSIYALYLRPTNSSPVYTTYAQAYQASTSSALQATACGSTQMANVIASETGTSMVAGAMFGAPTASDGQPAIMQAALAYAKDSGVPNADTAWNLFNQRQLKGDYSAGPQFAIVPR